MNLCPAEIVSAQRRALLKNYGMSKRFIKFTGDIND